MYQLVVNANLREINAFIDMIIFLELGAMKQNILKVMKLYLLLSIYMEMEKCMQMCSKIKI